MKSGTIHELDQAKVSPTVHTGQDCLDIKIQSFLTNEEKPHGKQQFYTIKWVQILMQKPNRAVTVYKSGVN